jgi:hypothetical protein
MNIHPEIGQFIGLAEFTHWLLIPENEQHYAFIKGIYLSDAASVMRLRSRGFQVFPFNSKPQGFRTTPEYKEQSA